MSERQEAKDLVGLVEDVIERGASTAEEVHRAVADLPFEMLDRIGVLKDAGGEAKRMQDQTIGAVYDLVRDINHKVSTLAADLLRERKPGAEAR